MGEDLKMKIDKLIEMGYTFHFLPAGQGMGCQIPSQIVIPYGCKDKEFIETIDRFYTESSSVVAECRRYIQKFDKIRNNGTI